MLYIYVYTETCVCINIHLPLSACMWIGMLQTLRPQTSSCEDGHERRGCKINLKLSLIASHCVAALAVLGRTLRAKLLICPGSAEDFRFFFSPSALAPGSLSLSLYRYIYVYTYLLNYSACEYMCMYVLYVYMCVCVSVHVHTYVCIYTYTPHCLQCNPLVGLSDLLICTYNCIGTIYLYMILIRF